VADRRTPSQGQLRRAGPPERGHGDHLRIGRFLETGRASTRDRADRDRISYEDALRRDARNEFPSDPAAQDAWVAERLPTGNRAWNWTSAEAQKNFRDTRHSSTRAFQHAKYSFALAILNRVASVIDTQMLHREDQKADQSSIDGPRLRILTDMTADGGGMLLVRSTF